MSNPLTEEEIDLREVLAEVAHSQWSGWMRYIFSKSTFNNDETITIPDWAAERWKRQAVTPYDQLSEDEKDSDRIEAAKFLEVFNAENTRRKSAIKAAEKPAAAEGLRQAAEHTDAIATMADKFQKDAKRNGDEMTREDAESMARSVVETLTI